MSANTGSRVPEQLALQGDLERAAALYADSLALARELGNRDQLALCLNNLGDVARQRGEVAQAEGRLREALAVSWELRDPRRCALGLAVPLMGGMAVLAWRLQRSDGSFSIAGLFSKMRASFRMR